MPPGALHFAKNLQKDFSYYFVNFCLEKKLGGLKGGAFIRGGGGALKRGYTVLTLEMLAFKCSFASI